MPPVEAVRRFKSGLKDDREMLAFAHISAGPTTTEGFNSDVDKSKIARTDTVATMATAEDDGQPGSPAQQILKAVLTSEAT